jgi:hypothetical protein
VPEYIDHPVHGHIHRAQVGMEADPGMSLRDWFAGQALVGLAACPTTKDDTANWFASASYAIADAMLAERAKP